MRSQGFFSNWLPLPLTNRLWGLMIWCLVTGGLVLGGFAAGVAFGQPQNDIPPEVTQRWVAGLKGDSATQLSVWAQMEEKPQWAQSLFGQLLQGNGGSVEERARWMHGLAAFGGPQNMWQVMATLQGNNPPQANLDALAALAILNTKNDEPAPADLVRSFALYTVSDGKRSETATDSLGYNNATFNALLARGIPEDILEHIRPLADKKFERVDALEAAVRAKLSPNQFDAYGATLLALAGKPQVFMAHTGTLKVGLENHTKRAYALELWVDAWWGRLEPTIKPRLVLIGAGETKTVDLPVRFVRSHNQGIRFDLRVRDVGRDMVPTYRRAYFPFKPAAPQKSK